MTISAMDARREILPALLLLAVFAGLAFLGFGRGKERFLDKAQRVPEPLIERDVRALMANRPNDDDAPSSRKPRLIPSPNGPEMAVDAEPRKPGRHYRIE